MTCISLYHEGYMYIHVKNIFDAIVKGNIISKYIKYPYTMRKNQVKMDQIN